MSNSYTTVILAIAGVILSLIFSYVPAAKAWYLKQANNGLIMLGFVFLVSLIYFGLGCTSFGAQLGITVSCTQSGAVDMLWGFVGCLTGNQLTYLVTADAQTAPPTK